MSVALRCTQNHPPSTCRDHFAAGAQFGCQLEFVTNKSQEGSQFCRGFGGIGGILRYSVDLTEFEEAEDLDGVEWDSDSDI